MRQIDASNEDSDIEEQDDIDFDIVAKKVFNHTIDELIEAEKTLETSDETEINWDENACDIVGILEENEKDESEDEDEEMEYESTETPIENVSNALDHVAYLKQFLMNKGFTDIMEDLSNVECKLEKEFVKQQQRATQTSIKDFFK